MSPASNMRARVIPQRLPLDPGQIAAYGTPARRAWILAYTSREIIAMQAMGITRDEIMGKIRRDLTEVLPLTEAECSEYMEHATRCYTLLSTLFPPGTSTPTPTDPS